MVKRWQGRLTWAALIRVIEQAKLVTYTRQALSKHSAIQRAYDNHQELPDVSAVKKRKRSASAEVQLVSDELDAAKTDVMRLKAENERLLGQFVRWAYNASQRGLTEEYLNQPLPEARRKRELEMQRVK